MKPKIIHPKFVTILCRTESSCRDVHEESGQGEKNKKTYDEWLNKKPQIMGLFIELFKPIKHHTGHVTRWFVHGLGR